MKPFYNWLYRTRRALWDIGPRKELVEADFGSHFCIEKLMEHCCGSGFLAGEAAYLMARQVESV
jgi:hypothetical protein